MDSLEDALDLAFAEFEVSHEASSSVKSCLANLQKKDLDTYKHSIRVGLLGARIARHMRLDPKILLFAGALHDLGKLLVDGKILKKTSKFSETDREKIRKHPEHSYNLLKGVHEFSAEIALRHHLFQEEGYPKTLPGPRVKYSAKTMILIDQFARLLALADSYDAITTRQNEYFGQEILTREDIKLIMLEKNPDQIYLVQDLYNNGIFGFEEPIKTNPVQDMLYETAWNEWSGKRNPKETKRQVMLACALEPIPDKPGCTTRGTDISRHLRLEYFIAGAINVGDAFEELSERILSAGKQPDIIYDLAKKAQIDCIKNRGGGRVNQGMLEMLVPIVASQTIYDPNYQLSASDVLCKAVDVMKDTTRSDVEELISMKRFAFGLSDYTDRNVPEHLSAATVYNYYYIDMENSATATGIAHNREFALGFPTILGMYESIMGNKSGRFDRRVEEAYARARMNAHKNIGKGLTADCIACAIYLALSHHPKERIIV